uniref:GAGE domain-containing protein n=1 Tax=Haemonchus contortus TaxID=6289 RepID=A0A7I4XY04_HAECO
MAMAIWEAGQCCPQASPPGIGPCRDRSRGALPSPPAPAMVSVVWAQQDRQARQRRQPQRRKDLQKMEGEEHSRNCLVYEAAPVEDEDPEVAADP